ncbi:MAG: DUF2138 family protein [Candidatus Schekmanbacteria bacterium]|nr:DUF2138 family protein [Candidatus Schekmanbacteria bacterium]
MISSRHARRNLTIAAIGAAVVAAGLAGWILLGHWQAGDLTFFGDDSFSPADDEVAGRDKLFQPDAVILTTSLSSLPRDIISVPVLNDLLSEDFVFYYEENEGRLGLEGTFRRIAYERNLGVGDEILAYVLNTSAQIAFWKGKDGKLKEYLLVVPRSGLLKYAGRLAGLLGAPPAPTVADSTPPAAERDPLAEYEDEQLARETVLPGDPASPVYRLEYTADKSLYFAARKDHLLVFSELELLVPEDASRTERVSEFLGSLDHQNLGRRFRLPRPAGRHSVVVGAEYLSFGYQRFFPAVRALRFDFSGNRWRTHLLSSAAFPSPQALWQYVPTGAALCAALPVALASVAEVAADVDADPALADFLTTLSAPVAVCWYGTSELQTPLFVALAPAKENTAATAALGRLFAATVGTWESEDGAKGPVTEATCTGGRVWSREVSSPYGPLEGEGMRYRHHFRVTLASCGGALLFSPDPRLVDLGVGVLQKKYPALADSLSEEPDAVVVLAPAGLAQLLESALMSSLPSAQEPVFRTSVVRSLLPLLKRAAEYPGYVLPAPQRFGEWEVLAWKEWE